VRTISLPILSLCLLAFAGASTPRVQGTSDLLGQFLHDRMGFSAAEIADVKSGRAIAKQMKTPDPIDVNIFGAVRLAASADAFIQQVRHIDEYERRIGINAVGKFRTPAQLADLDGLVLDRDELEEVRACRPADCDAQFSPQTMARFRKEINWRAPNAGPVASQIFREELFTLLNLYRAGGHPALPAYDDRPKSSSLAAEFRHLLVPGDMPSEIPDLWRYLIEYPKYALPGAEDVFYWNKGEFGMKPTIRLNHITIYPVPHPHFPDPLRFVVATSQIYSNHYFSATLELRSIVDDPEHPGTGCYLLYTTRSRVSGLTGFMGTLLRSLVRSRARSGMEKYLIVTKKAVETAR
jgi:hypothetical protein